MQGNVEQEAPINRQAGVPPKVAAAQQDKEMLQGTWKVVGTVVNGAKLDEQNVPKLQWVITAERITWSDGKSDFLYKLDADKKPAQMDLTFPERKTEKTEGIYALDRDDLTVCVGKTERPTDFTAKDGSKRFLYLLKRIKKEAEKPKDGVGNKETTLRVTIKPQQNRIRANEAFKVDLRVMNSSKSTQTFRVMSCSWDEHWKSSNNRVSWEPWPCAQNVVETVKLEPGEAYEKTLPMLVLTGKPQEKLSFEMGFTPIDSKQTTWSNEVTVQVEDKKQARFVPIASYRSVDRVAEKRIRELLDAAKITFISVGSRGLTASVAEDKAKQARAILEKAVVAGTLSVTVLDELPVPKKLRAVRTDNMLRIEEDTASNEKVIVPVAAGLIRSTDCWWSVYRGKERVSHTGGTYTPALEFNRNNSKIPRPGESYEVELVVKWFETDAPIRPNWAPQSGGRYKVLVTRTLKLSVGPENTKPAPPPNK